MFEMFFLDVSVPGLTQCEFAATSARICSSFPVSSRFSAPTSAGCRPRRETDSVGLMCFRCSCSGPDSLRTSLWFGTTRRVSWWSLAAFLSLPSPHGVPWWLSLPPASWNAMMSAGSRPHCEPDSEGLVCFLLFQICALSLDGCEGDMGAKAGPPHVVPVNASGQPRPVLRMSRYFDFERATVSSHLRA